MLKTTQKILAIVAHPDDEIIGVGGALCKHINAGDEVHVLILGDGKSSRNNTYTKLPKNLKEKSLDETRKALSCLGINSFFKENFPDNRFDSINMLDLAKKVSFYVNDTNHRLTTQRTGPARSSFRSNNNRTLLRNNDYTRCRLLHDNSRISMC